MQYCVLAGYGFADDDRWEFVDSPNGVLSLSTVQVRFREGDRQAMFAVLERMALGDRALFVGRGVALTIICCKGD